MKFLFAEMSFAMPSLYKGSQVMLVVDHFSIDLLFTHSQRVSFQYNLLKLFLDEL